MLFTQDRLEPFGETLIDLTVENNLGYKTPLVFRTLSTLQRQGYLPEYGTHMCELCLEEALANAIIHGNALDSNRELRLIVCGDGERFGIFIDDQGSGFAESDLPDPEDLDALMAESGRGIRLMDHYADSVTYSTGGTANRLAIVRAKQTEPDPGAMMPVRLDDDEPVPQDGEIGEVELVPVEVTPRVERKVELGDDIELGEPEPLPDVDEAPVAAAASQPTAAEPDTAVIGDAEQREEHGPVTLIHFGPVIVAEIHADRISEDNAPAVRMPLIKASDEAEALVIDMLDVTFMSSVGIGTIMAVYKKVVTRKGKVVICGVQPEIESIFKAAGVIKLLKIEADQEAALESLL